MQRTHGTGTTQISNQENYEENLDVGDTKDGGDEGPSSGVGDVFIWTMWMKRDIDMHRGVGQ